MKATICHKLRNIAKMKAFLTESQMQTIVQSLILSSLDYCNSLFYGLNQSTMKKLQTLQNRACRIIKGLKKRESVEESLKDLHWLKVPQRIEFKLILLVFKCLNGLAPSYLSNKLRYRSCGSRGMLIESTETESNCFRAFSSSAPHLWNNLPLEIRQTSSITVFKSKVKTYLFRKCFDLDEQNI